MAQIQKKLRRDCWLELMPHKFTLTDMFVGNQNPKIKWKCFLKYQPDPFVFSNPSWLLLLLLLFCPRRMLFSSVSKYSFSSVVESLGLSLLADLQRNDVQNIFYTNKQNPNFRSSYLLPGFGGTAGGWRPCLGGAPGPPGPPGPPPPPGCCCCTAVRKLWLP